MTATHAAAWADYGLADYATWTDRRIIDLVDHCGADFARLVQTLEESQPHPSPDVLHACDLRLGELAG